MMLKFRDQTLPSSGGL